MQRLLFIISYPFIFLISKLPFKVLYVLSDVFYLIIYKLIGYRRNVVKNNIQIAFPEKSEDERIEIEKRFYKHFCDLIFETIKTYSISKKELVNRFKITNPDVITKLENKGKSVIYMCAHYNNYEWILALRFFGMKNTSYGVYKSLKNKSFDKLLKRSRSKFQTYLIDKNYIAKKMAENKLKNKSANYGMIADQSPKRKHAKYWVEFMGQKTPVFTGSELLARRLDIAVVYMKIEKISRGYYKAELQPIALQPKKTQEGDVTKSYFQKLENQILEKPEYYLWSHKRWKHKDLFKPELHYFF